MTDSSTPGRLERRLGLLDSVVIGVGSMIGAGVYSVWGPATRSADSLLLIGLLVASIVALFNAVSSTRLAVVYPESGGTYVYGRERLGNLWGFAAGWGFVVGKTASCAAMATTFGLYLFPNHSRFGAIAAIGLITLVNIGGLHRTVGITKILLFISAATLLLVVVSAWGNTSFEPEAILPTATNRRSILSLAYDVLQSAGLLFFAFAGYARIATLGEEVRNPRVTIPRAIAISLAVVVVVYMGISSTLLGALSPEGLAASVDPLRRVVDTGPVDHLAPLVGFGAAVATLGALLNLLPGVSRTALAMARRGDAPRGLAVVDSRRSLPVRAELTVAIAAIVIVAVFDLRNSISLSGVGVLVYYAIANASALTLPSGRRMKCAAVAGLAGCLTLLVCLPARILVTGSVILVTGIVARTLHGLVSQTSRTGVNPPGSDVR